ncbi:MAG: hypothetical protein SNF33_04105 [Candidatus Algichlamydia australiensis]|nr:hypothetical protein [Chlamydiales bacterium]
MKRFVLFFICFALLQADPFERVVIWGHKLHTHTHSYIHNAFYRAFKHLGYETYWLDEKDDLSKYDLSNSLFITEGQADTTIPLRDDSYYFLHNCSHIQRLKKQKDAGRTFCFQVYTDDVLTRKGLTKYAPCHYYSVERRALYMPWATDLLPHEIEENKLRLLQTEKEKKIYWIGTIGSGEFGNMQTIQPFKSASNKKRIPFITKRRVSVKENRDLIMRSFMAPTIVGPWQAKKGYVPCRIFKNISYGQMGVTNSKRVYELFNRKIIYNSDTAELFNDAYRQIPKISNEEIFELMDFVKENHTYLNRIEFMLKLLREFLVTS